MNMDEQRTKGFQNSIVRLLSLDLNEFSRFPAWALRQIKVTYYVGLEFIHDRCLLRASSMTYTTILSLVPLMVVFFSWFSRMKLSEEEVRNVLSQYLFPNADLFRTIQNHINKFSENTAALSTFGSIFVFAIAYSLVNTMEKTFNEIWHVTEKRSLWDKVSSFWLTLTLAPILIALSIFMTSKIKSLPALSMVFEYPLFKASLIYIIPFILIWLAFFMLYKLLPYTHVGTYPAAGGAAAAAILFALGKWGFGLYVTHFNAYSKIYGAVAAIPALLLYIFLIWIIVFLGAELSYVLQYPELYEKGAAAGPRAGNYRGYLALRMMIEITRRFRSGKGPAGILEISQKLGIAYELVEEILHKLKEEGLVHQLENRHAFVPARDTEKISAAEVIEAVRGKLLQVLPSPDEPERRLIQDLFSRGSAAFQQNLGNVSMDRMIEDLDRPAAGDKV
ncbi:MAG: YhjD/YihY/BrkB family envelope integrity protein [bacterium]